MKKLESYGSCDWHFSYDLTALRLEYKTTCDALTYWRGGDPAEQQFLLEKSKKFFVLWQKPASVIRSGTEEDPSQAVSLGCSY
ncbi:hypothetical protein FZX13_02705 [Synechococcus sp. MU1625]|nr:hypothetical protein [Synechococcus sp. MU1625]